MTDSVQEALAAAQAAAAASTASSNAVAPVTGAAGGAVATLTPGRRLSTQDRIGSTFSVTFLKFTELGTMTLGASNKQFEKFHVMLDLSEIEPGWAIRVGNNPVRYIRTTDGAITTDGKSWEAELIAAKQIDPKTQPYNSWNIPFTLLEDVPEHPKGEKIGFATVWSTFREFQPVYDKLVAEHGPNAVIELNLTCKGTANKAGNKYGVPVFEVIGTVEPQE